MYRHQWPPTYDYRIPAHLLSPGPPPFPLGLDPHVDDHISPALRVPPLAPNVLLGDWVHGAVSLRERAMLWVMNEITDMEGWPNLVADDAVVASWAQSLVGLGAPPTPSPSPSLWALPPLPPHLRAAGFSATMLSYVLAELLVKSAAATAENYHAVRVFDCDAGVYKLTLPAEFAESTGKAMAKLEAEARKIGDYRPDHGYAVLNLVHNTMYPVVYGRTRVVKTAIPLDRCLEAMGSGTTLPSVPPPRLLTEDEAEKRRYGHQLGNVTLNDEESGYAKIRSTALAWLPADVVVDNGRPRIISYINNLHPIEQKSVYTVIEDLLQAVLPTFVSITERVQASRKSVVKAGKEQEITDTSPLFNRIQFSEPLRIRLKRINPQYGSFPENKAWFEATHTPVQPEPSRIPPVDKLVPTPEGKWFKHGLDRLQILVQINNHILTPENPTYAGGQWHVEGMLNEHIVASAVYYYDIENITQTTLDFRATHNALPPDIDHKGVQSCSSFLSYLSGDDTRTRAEARHAIYGGQHPSAPTSGSARSYDEPPLPLGGVRARKGRVTVFPNVFEHRVSGFQLADKTREGHRKMIAIFLVDPALRVLSSAHVPPQQLHWAVGEKRSLIDNIEKRLPRELVDQIYKDVQCPYNLTEAFKIRELIMAERGGGPAGGSLLPHKKGGIFND